MTGVLSWGLPKAFGIPLVKELFFDGPGPRPDRLAISPSISSLGVFWLGQKMWTDKERRYVECRGRRKAGPANDG